jgi:uncharacterized protein (DUF924 family)
VTLLPPIALLALLVGSWTLRPESRVLAYVRGQKEPAVPSSARSGALALGGGSLLLVGGVSVCAPHQTPLASANSAGTSANTEVQSSRAAPSIVDGAAVVAFWREAGPRMWFAKDPEFDRRFRERFIKLHEAAARGELMAWRARPESALALIILLDQFPRNAFRGTPRMYATDAAARAAAHAAIAAGHDQATALPLRLFMYLPFGHSENLADQERSVELSRSLGEPNITHARRHRDIVHRFGRFPHRNPILGRTMRPEEQRFLDEGGYAG